MKWVSFQNCHSRWGLETTWNANFIYLQLFFFVPCLNEVEEDAYCITLRNAENLTSHILPNQNNLQDGEHLELCIHIFFILPTDSKNLRRDVVIIIFVHLYVCCMSPQRDLFVKRAPTEYTPLWPGRYASPDIIRGTTLPPWSDEK